MQHTIISLLAERPEAELRRMLARAHEDVTRLRTEIARAQVEVEQIEQALTRQTRRESGTTRTGETREQVLDAIRSAPGVVRPVAIIDALRAQGSTVSNGAIRNMIRRLVDEGTVEHVSEGRYQLASRNGSSSEPRTGPTENEATEPLLTVTEPQEAD